jgi:DNA-binding response OmpR family regulator
MVDKVLVVEDDLDIATLIQVNLAELGLDITHYADGAEACDAALNNDYCLILLFASCKRECVRKYAKPT